MPQTAQAATFLAMAAAAQAAHPDMQLISDCLGVVQACQRGARQPQLHRRTYGGLVRAAFQAMHAQSVLLKLEKVKAHQEWKTLPAGHTRDRAQGNAAADEEAKLARNRHPRGPNAKERVADRETAGALEVAGLIG